jgi:hypothetical protein
MPRATWGGLLLLVLLVISNLQGWCQEAPAHENPADFKVPASHDKRLWGDYELKPGEDPENRIGMPFLRHLVTDQRNFWTSPARIRSKDLPLLLPFMATTAGLIASDSWMSKQVPDRPDQLKTSRDISNYSVAGLIGVSGGSFLLGKISGNDHLREAGFLSGEAALNSTAVDYALKGLSQRPRPMIGNGNGTFFQGGSSFPSQHAAAAWSIASVFAHEYPGPLSKVLAYGLASAVTLTRVTSQQHFPSDALIGSALGWFIGRQVYRAHHDSELGGSAWGSFLELGDRGPRNPENMGSPYVPIDSWVYPAFDRLITLGYLKTAHTGLRPWTRMQCATLVEELGEAISQSGDTLIGQMYESLATEFEDEVKRLNGSANLGVSLDSVYTRSMFISGTTLRDGFNFGQTIINDFGRPFGEGFNNVTGFTSHAVLGPIFMSVQGEYQHAPAVPSDPQSVLDATATGLGVLPLSNATLTIDRFRLLDAAIGVNFRNTQISFGKQTLWLGPGEGGPFLFSNNAEPIPMFRVDQLEPVHVPGLSRILGPIRTEFFLGRLSGLHWIFADNHLIGPNIDNQPFIHGEKITFKPTGNLEFGFGITTMFGGDSLPVTWKNFLRTFTNNGLPGTASDPGDRRSTFEFSYRVPYIRDYLTVYADSLVEDEVSPIGSTRPSMRLGMHFPKIPGLPKLELQMEGVYTDVPGQVSAAGFIYSNGRFLSGYTNNGNLMGSWIGRYGRGGQGWATYWFNARSKAQLMFRRQTNERDFLGGGQMNNFGASGEVALTPDVSISGNVQFEQWNYPVLRPNPQTDFMASFQVNFHPRFRLAK